MSDGTCAAAADVAYVNADGTDNTECSQTTPCSSVSAGLATGRSLIKIRGALTEEVTITRDVELIGGAGSRIKSNGSAAIHLVGQDTKIGITDLVVQGGTTAVVLGDRTRGQVVAVRRSEIRDGGFPIQTVDRVVIDRSTIANTSSLIVGGEGLIRDSVFEAVGIIATGDDRDVTVERTVIRNVSIGVLIGSFVDITQPHVVVRGCHISGTTFAAISLSHGTVDVSHNILVRNATAVITNQDGQGSFTDNTLVDNGSNDSGTGASAFRCDGGVHVLARNLIFRNRSPQNSGTGCSLAGSLVLNATSPSDNTPRFVNPNAGTNSDYHLTADTPASIRDAAVGCSGTDFDGDPRPSGTGCDFGADEFVP